MDLEKEKIEKSFFRNLDIETAKVEENEENFIYTLSFASEEPYERWFGMEIIKVEEMDLSRINNNAPLLFNHNPDKIIGVVEKSWIKDKKAYAEVRLSKTNEEAVKIKKMIDEKILTKVSFGYKYLESKFLKEENNLDFYEFKVLPFEVSIVSVPADDTVGIEKELKRDLEILKKNFLEYNNNIDLNLKKEKGIKNMENELKEILDLGKLTNNLDLALKFVDEGRSLDDFKKEISAKQKTEVKKVDEVKDEIKVKNLGEEILNSLSNRRGFKLNSENYRDYNGFKVTGAGKELTTTTFADIVSNIKNEHILKEIGFDVRENVYGDLVIPVLQEAPNGVTQTEEDVVIEGKAFTTTQFRIEKETFTLPIKHSYEILKQSSEYIQQYLIAEGLKAYYTQVGKLIIKKFLDDVTLAHTPNGAPLNYADVVDVQDKAWVDGEGKFLVSKKLLNKLKTIEKFAGTATPIYDGKTIDGEDFVVNKIKPSGVENEYLVYGDLSKFVVALFGYPDVYIDPTPDSKNQFTIKFIGMFGGKLTNPHAVCKANVTLS